MCHSVCMVTEHMEKMCYGDCTNMEKSLPINKLLARYCGS